MPADIEPRVRATALSRLLRGTTYAHLLPLLPLAVRRLHVPPTDVVIASHHAFANQVVYATDAPVVSYVHSPARWVWDPNLRAGEVGAGSGSWGWARSRRSTAPWTSPRRPGCTRCWATPPRSSAGSRTGGSARPPSCTPVDTERYVPDPEVPREGFFLLAGRLVAYKRPDLAVRAAERAGVPLVVAGDGRARAELEALAGPNTRFLGRVDDDELLRLFRSCTALLMPGVEDFGIVPVEAQACGTPVIAIDAGGTQDTVVPGVTGELVPQVDDDVDEVELWAAALRTFDPSRYDPAITRKHAEGFSRSTFRERMRGVVAGVLA
ncbi:glycosyltransferase [Klenkia terrae]|uniref:glycosyltransferase n=1 Tax=Klenkia terrae TaxID=1052259 RepID=UPI00360FA94D